MKLRFTNEFITYWVEDILFLERDVKYKIKPITIREPLHGEIITIHYIQRSHFIDTKVYTYNENFVCTYTIKLNIEDSIQLISNAGGIQIL